MANQKVPQLPVLSAVTGEDLFYVVDVSDTTDDPTGSSKQITRDEILTEVNQIDFSTTATTTAQVGRLHWNNADEVGTLELDLIGGNVQLQIGEENLVRVYNADSVTLSVGTVVYVFGSQGNTLSVKRASASGETTSSRTLGIVRESIVAGERGFVSVGGLVHGLDTSSYSGGTPLWLSTTLGQITNIPPEAPNHIVLLGFVSRVSATVGSVFVHISNGWELDELHNVIISGVTNGDILAYNSGTTAWENTKTLNGDYRINGSLSATTVSATTFYGSGTNLTGVVKGSGTSNYLPKWTGTTGLGNSIIQDNGTQIGVGGSPNTAYKMIIYGGGGNGIYGYSTAPNKYGVLGGNFGDDLGTYAGGYFSSTYNDTPNIANIYIGAVLYANADAGGTAYGAQVQDGTEGVNKVLISATADGKTNWSSSLSALTFVQATTISATTYQNLPIDIRVTGGTYSNTTGIATFTNNTGGTFNVSGFTTGLTTSDYICQGYLSTNQSIPSNVDTVIQFIDDFDPQNWWNSSTYRFQPTISGYYNITLEVFWQTATVANNQYNSQIRKNGSQIYIWQNQTTTSAGVSQGNSKIVYFNGTTDYIEFTGYNGDPTNRNIEGGSNRSTSYFSASLIAGANAGGTTYFTGGTINGPTVFTDGLTANTMNISATPTNNDSPTQVLTRNSTTGEVEITSPQSPGLFNYGLANAIMTGNFLT